MNQKHVSHIIFADVENIFNRQNVLGEIYDSDKKQVVYKYQLGFISVWRLQN